jgi:hypothetical protein
VALSSLRRKKRIGLEIIIVLEAGQALRLFSGSYPKSAIEVEGPWMQRVAAG